MALEFSTKVLGLEKKTDLPADPDGVELVLEPVHKQHERITALGGRFTSEPTPMGPVTAALLDDTCGNLVQLVS